MKVRSAKYHIKQGAKSITKNGLMSVASIASVAACAFILIISLCIAINIDAALEKIEQTIGVSLYLGDSVTDEEAEQLYEQLKAIPNVTEIVYMTKEDALAWAKNEWSEQQDILSGLEDDNPFPRSFELSIASIKNQRQVINDVTKLQNEFEQQLLDTREKEQQQIQDIIENPLAESTTVSSESTTNTTETTSQTGTEGVSETESVTEEKVNIGDANYEYIGIEKIGHSQNEADILLAINNAVRIASIIIILILAIVSVAIIVNTIKLTVYVRKTEINIMKYVGATDWFIRWPFVIEGIIIGVIGAIIPTVICSFGYSQTVGVIYEKMPFIKNYIEFKDTFTLFLAIAPVTIILGALLGVIGSVNSIKKHLNV